MCGKSKYISVTLVLVVTIMAALTACSSGSEAVPVNAAVVSESTSSSVSEVSGVSSLVSSSTPDVSSAVSIQPEADSKPTSSAPASKPSSTKPTSKPVSTVPTSKPVSKPASKPASQAPTSKPASQPPASTSFSPIYHGATYGCSDKSQYSLVLQKAGAAKSSSAYKNSYSTFSSNQDVFETMTGVPYSDAWNDIVALMAAIPGSEGSASTGSAYDYFTGANRTCGDKAKALEAALHCAGYDAKLAVGTYNGSPHMWTMVKVNGTWYHLTTVIGTSPSKGFSMSSSGYNL